MEFGVKKNPVVEKPPVVKSSKNYRDPNRNIRHLCAISGRLRRPGVITILVVKMKFVKGKRNLIRPPKAVEIFVTQVILHRFKIGAPAAHYNLILFRIRQNYHESRITSKIGSKTPPLLRADFGRTGGFLTPNSTDINIPENQAERIQSKGGGKKKEQDTESCETSSWKK